MTIASDAVGTATHPADDHSTATHMPASKRQFHADASSSTEMEVPGIASALPEGLSSCNPEPTPASKRQRYAAAGISSISIGAKRRAAGHATTRDSKRPRTSLSEDTASAIAAVDRLRAIRAVESGINHHDPG